MGKLDARAVLRVSAFALIAASHITGCDEPFECADSPPAEPCFDVCTGASLFATCVQGRWTCLEQDPRRSCGTCGDYPENPPACVDACGEPEMLVCQGDPEPFDQIEVPSEWTCLTHDFAPCEPVGAAEWGISILATGAADIATADAGSSVIVGTYAYLDFASFSDTSEGTSDVFVAKHDASGDLLWVKSDGGSGPDEGLAIDINTANDIAVASQRTHLLSIALLGPGGAQVWRHDSDVQVDEAYDPIAIDNFGRVVVTGTATPGSSIGGMAVPVASFFVMMLASDGTPLWVRGFDAAVAAIPRAIDVGANGQVFVAGEFQGALGFGGASIPATGSGDNGFVLQLDALGNDLWIRTFSGEGAGTRASQLAAYGDGGVVATGGFSGTLSLDDGSMLEGNGTLSGFATRIAPDGATMWAEAITSDGSVDPALDVAIDGLGDIVIAGRFYGRADGLQPHHSQGEDDILLLKISLHGGALWGYAFGSDSSDGGSALTAHDDGHITLFGHYTQELDLGHEELDAEIHSVNSTPGQAMFLASFEADGFSEFNWVPPDQRN